MSEIQKEEARASALLAMQREGSRPSGSGWANVAASRSGSVAWTGGAAKPVPAAAVLTPSVQLSTPSVAPAAATAPKGRQGSASSKDPGAISAGAGAKPPADSSKTTAEEFGAKMSPSMEKWCKDQMTKLNGTDDLTLVSFCMSLNDPGEIRQYLTAYLGTTPQVNGFATEFINRRGFNLQANKQEEWESTATAKKTRKAHGKGKK
jgi:PERQ amino acid-rich with GYF domain-containing protein